MSTKETKFFDLAMKSDSLLLGDFTLKSGKQSPYFFNIGSFFDTGLINQLSDLYSELILESDFTFSLTDKSTLTDAVVAAVALSAAEVCDVSACDTRDFLWS